MKKENENGKKMRIVSEAKLNVLLIMHKKKNAFQHVHLNQIFFFLTKVILS